MLNNLNKENIITKSQVYEQVLPCKILGGSFAKTVNYQGIHYNFCLDIPEILEKEQKQQEKANDIARFTMLAMSDFDSRADDELIKKLFQDKNVDDLYDESIYASLARNKELLEDLDLL